MSIKLVSENPADEIARRRAQEAAERAEERARGMVNWRLRDLTANLIRVARGAGKPYDLEEQAARFVEACDEYREQVGRGVSSEDIHEILRVRRYLGQDRERTPEQHAWNDGEESMVAGALQIAASRILGQRTQEVRGHSEMFDGLQIIEREREESRRRWAASQPAVSKGRKRKPTLR